MKQVLSLIVIILVVVMICNISLAKTENNNPLLENIEIEGINFNFDYMQTEYVLSVPETVETIKINAIPQDENATINIIGDTNLKMGVNKFEIQVTAEDREAKQTYLVSITRGNAEKANANLKSLEVENSTIAPYFQKDIIEYVVKYPSNQTSLQITAEPESENAKIDIQGNEKLTQTIQKITITVTAGDSITKKNYTILAKKLGQVVEDPYGENISTEAENIGQNDVKRNLLIVVVVLIIIIIAVILIKKYKNKGGVRK